MTRDRWPDLRLSLPRHSTPVVLVDNGSTDGTPALVRKHFPHVEVMALDRNRGASARNIGVERVDTPLVAFADDDSWWAPRALSTAAAVFGAAPRLGLLAARTLVGPEQVEDSFSTALAQSPLGRAPDLPGPSVLGFMACAAVVRVDAFRTAGGFDDVVFFMGEEERLALDLASLGWALCYVDSVVAHHHPSPSRGVRDLDERQVLVWRNRVLTSAMRRPWGRVATCVRDALTAGPAGRRGALRAGTRLHRALRARRRVPPSVEAGRRLLDAAASRG